jgi:primosomal protein N' (replication factor Y) (superfamily II helicase)
MRVEVALPLPVHRTFTYEVDDELAIEGLRVRVAFNRRRLVGWIVGPAEPKQLSRVRSVEAALESRPALPADVLALCRWIADYYVTPLGVVIRAALPAALSDTARPDPPVRTRRVVQLVREVPSLEEREHVFGRAKRQRAAFEYLESAGGSADATHLIDQLGFSDAVLRGLVQRGLAEFHEARVDRDPFAERPQPTATPRLVPTPAQQDVIARILGAPSPALPVLLPGVTGSGKTLVYLEVLEQVVLTEQRGAIVLVPEIALTPQTVARFRARFGDTVAVLHSALSDGERYDAWSALREGRRRIAIGARSAIFAPVHDLGVIVVDEEHEATYKQSESPRYHAREVAVMRAKAAAARCVLGSATPALESWHNAQNGKYVLLSLPERIENRPLPPVHIVDLRQTRRPDGRGPLILSPPLAAAVEDRLARREQTILLLNRRGYSSFVQCRDCGYVRRCAQCNVSLTWHRMRRRLVCHYCFREEPTPTACHECGSADLSFRGIGTEQVEREVAESFPAARIARMDVDTTSGKWAHHDILERVGAGDVDILLGTQMIAKGLDFPNVTLVGVVDADVAMNLPDFRAAERTFQLLTQVAGRAGRGPRGGEVIVQTALPSHYAIRAAVDHDYVAFAARELEERRGPAYPPFSRLANVVMSGPVEQTVVEGVDRLATWTAAAIRRVGRGRVALIGPAPCPIDRIRGRWRWHFLLRSADAHALGAVCHALQQHDPAGEGAGELRFIIDRDPVTLL